VTKKKTPKNHNTKGKANRKKPVVNEPRLSTNMKLTIAMVALVVLGLAGVIYVANDAAPSATASEDLLVRDDSHTLSVADDNAITLVEFLDFECEACGALYPTMERLLSEYDGQFTFVVRYFPLQGHANADPAARAVEAAAKQGQFEGMYQKMFETQPQWGEKQESQEPVFFGFAQELGLDMDQFAADFADPKTAERVRKDVNDGTALGVTGTPTIFVNGERVAQPSYETLKSLFDAELGN